MRRKNDIFDDIDDETVEKLSQEFPVLTDEEKDRIFAMSERKYNIVSEIVIENDEDVKGVEQYRRPVWHRFAGIAAAIAIIAGRAGSGAVLMNSLKKSAPIDTATSENETVETTDSTTEDVSKFMAPAKDLTERYADFETSVVNHALTYDKNDTLTFIIERTDGVINVEESIWYRVVDQRYPDMASLRTQFEALYEPVDAPEGLFGGEFTSEELPAGSVISHEMAAVTYMTYDGKLYLNSMGDLGTFDYWINSDIDIRKVSDNEFYASRKCMTTTISGENSDKCDEQVLVFHILRNTRSGGWYIDYVTKNGEAEYNNPDEVPTAMSNSADVSAEELINNHLTFYNYWQNGQSSADDVDIQYNPDDYISFNIQRDSDFTVWYRKMSDYNGLDDFIDSIHQIYTDKGFDEIYSININDLYNFDLSSHQVGDFITEDEYTTVIEYNGAVYLKTDPAKTSPVFKYLQGINNDQPGENGSSRVIDAYLRFFSNGGYDWARSTNVSFNFTLDSDGKFKIDHVSELYSDEQTKKIYLAETFYGFKNGERLYNGIFYTDESVETIPSDDESRPYAVCTEYENVAELRNYLETYMTTEFIEERFEGMFEGDYPVFKDIDGKLYGKRIAIDVLSYWSESLKCSDPEKDMEVTDVTSSEVLVDFHEYAYDHSDEDETSFNTRMYAEIPSDSRKQIYKITKIENPDARG
ncbi:MAG TPA: hypothetical protein P5191_10885 [Ruminococcus sp.]|nr:hypothetical protein [Ruminococcus sp.]